jgi:hypothetical protein
MKKIDGQGQDQAAQAQSATFGYGEITPDQQFSEG